MRQRAPQGHWQALAEGTRAQRVPGAGRTFAASPVLAQQMAVARATLGATTATEATGPAWDEFVLASTTPTLTLTYLPEANESTHVFLGPAFQRENVDYTLVGQTLTILAGMDAEVGQLISVRYRFRFALPVPAISYDSDYVTAVMSDDPVAYYRLDDTGSSLTDFTGHGHTGTQVGTVTKSQASLLTTDSNTCMSFTSSGGYFTIPGHAAFNTGAFSFELWTNKGSSSLTITAGQTARFGLGLSANSILTFWDPGLGSSVTVSTATGILNGSDGAITKHIIVAFDGAGTVTWFKDGAVHTTTTGISTALPSNTNTISMGYISGSDGLFKSDEWAIYDYALTEAQAATHFAAR